MLCLSVKQPNAMLIVLGIQTKQTRSWCTGQRGRIAIHASRKHDDGMSWQCGQEPMRSWLRRAGYGFSADLPRGQIIGTVDLVDCVPVPDLDSVNEVDRLLDPFPATSYAWVFANAKRLAVPVPWPGCLGLFQAAIETSEDASRGRGCAPIGAAHATRKEIRRCPGLRLYCEPQ